MPERCYFHQAQVFLSINGGLFMWYIVKAELRYYYKIVLIPLICINILLAIAFLTSGKIRLGTDIIGVPSVALVVTAVAAFMIIVDRAKTKRSRFLAVLPVSVRSIGISQYLSLYIIWAFILAVFCCTLMIFRPEAAVGDVALTVFTFNGIYLYFSATYIMSRDLCFVRRPAGKAGIRIDLSPGAFIPLLNFLLLLYFVLLPVPYIGIEPPLYTDIVQFMFSLTGAIVLNIFGLCLVLAGVFVYSRRLSFLE